jgi:hypothetical protein
MSTQKGPTLIVEDKDYQFHITSPATYHTYYISHPIKLHKTCHFVPRIVVQVIVQFMFWYFVENKSLLCSTRACRVWTQLARNFDIIITTSLTNFILNCLLRTLAIYHPHYYTPHPLKLHKTCHFVPCILLQFMFQYFVLNKKFIMFDKRLQDSNPPCKEVWFNYYY